MRPLLILLLTTQIVCGQHIEGNLIINNLEVVKITYEGNWRINASGCNCSFSNTKGDKVRIEFVGTNIWVYGEALKSHGIATVFLDGIQYPMMDQYGDPKREHFVQWQATNLPYGSHVLELIVSGYKNPLANNNYLVFRGADINHEEVKEEAKIDYNINYLDTVYLDSIIWITETIDSVAIVYKDSTIYRYQDSLVFEYYDSVTLSFKDTLIINYDTIIVEKDSTVLVTTPCPEIIESGTSAWKIMIYIIAGLMLSLLIVFILFGKNLYNK